MTSTNKFLRFIKLSWKGYICLCVIFSTIIGTILLIGTTSYLSRHIKFPNGVTITSFFYHPNGFKLLNENGRTILKVHSGEVISQGEYVFGMASDIEDGKVITKDFIYKVGWQKPIMFSDNGEASFSDMSRKLGLRWSLDYPADLFEREYYQQCIENDGKSECKYKTLDKFWADIESGKEPLYICDQKKSRKPCGSYSLFKTYLSLLKIPRYRVN